MTDYSEILKKLETETKVISDDSLRRIAFERLLEHELSGGKSQNKKNPSAAKTTTPHTKAKRVNSRGNPTSAASSVRDEVSKFRLSPDEPELPKWGSLGALDKYLWVLEVANRNKVDGLTSVEISSLIYEAFKENHGPGQVSNLKTRIKQAHVRPVRIQCGAKKLTGYQILKDGIDHLKKLATDGGK
jgi:hypothetical protein